MSSARKTKKIMLTRETSYMANRLGELLEMEPVEAVRFSLFLATVTVAVSPESVEEIKEQMRQRDANPYGRRINE